MKMKFFFIPLVLLLALQAACIKKPDVTPQPVSLSSNQSLLDILGNNYDFSMFYSALKRTGLIKALQSSKPLTLLVPDNDAFSRSGITADSLARIDTATLHKLIAYHIVETYLPYASVPQSIDYPFPSLAGPSVYFSVPIPGPHIGAGSTGLHINGVLVTKDDILANNGVIHVLNTVLNYPAASVKSFLLTNPNYSYFAQALKQFGLLDQLDKPGPFVVTAPNNDVFIQHGIDAAALAKLDTLTYKKMLFSTSILPKQRFFVSDFADAPVDFTGGLPMPDYIVYFVGTGASSFGIVPTFFQDIIAQGTFHGPYYGNIYIYGEQVSMTDPDHLALNGVVQGVNGLQVLPDSVRIKH